MSTSPEAVSRAPKRQRGRLRVAAIMEAGAEIFMERGYDAATMTEIAARSRTAIGSLYRFFPTKEVLAEALLNRYGELLGQGFAAIERNAATLDAAAIGNALVDLMLSVR